MHIYVQQAHAINYFLLMKHDCNKYALYIFLFNTNLFTHLTSLIARKTVYDLGLYEIIKQFRSKYNLYYQ